MSAKTAIHIVALLNSASSSNTPLIPRARLMFCHRIVCVLWESRISSGMHRRSSLMMTTSAASKIDQHVKTSSPQTSA